MSARAKKSVFRRAGHQASDGDAAVFQVGAQGEGKRIEKGKVLSYDLGNRIDILGALPAERVMGAPALGHLCARFAKGYGVALAETIALNDGGSPSRYSRFCDRDRRARRPE